MPSDPLPFDPHRFRTAALHYRLGRAPYPPALIRRVAEALRLDEDARVLDLGCGPAQLAIGFAYFAGQIIGLDPEPEMIAAARDAARGLAPNAEFRLGSSYDLGSDLGPVRLAVMGRSFHWMDRAALLARLDKMIERNGAVVLFHDTHLDVPENAWRTRWREIADRYASGDTLRKRRAAGTWLSHEAVLLQSPFCRLERLSLVTRRVSSTASLIERALSMSSTSHALIGKEADEMAAELAALMAEVAPDGQVVELLEWNALIARRCHAA